MRLFATVAILGLVSGMPAMAQTTTTNTGASNPQMIYAVPVYNAMPSGTQYQQGSPTVYNNGTASPLPLQQMTAGKNAPSYNYNGAAPYSGFNTGGNPMAGADMSNLTPEQRRYIDAQTAANYQQEQYMREQQNRQALQQQQQMLQQQQQPFAQTNSYLGTGNFNNPFAEPEQKPKQRRVVYNERNNPLVTPPRLFNPDQ